MVDQKKLQKWLGYAINQNLGQFAVHAKNLTYDSNSLYLFSYKLKIRYYAVWLTEWRFFDNLVIFLIIIGSICQAMQSSYTNDQYDDKITRMKQILEEIMNFTTYFFIFEASMKIVS